MGACSSDIERPPEQATDFDFETKETADKPSNGYEWADWFGIKKEMALTREQAELVWGSMGDIDTVRLGKHKFEDLYAILAESLVDALIASESENIALKKVRYTIKFERRLSLKVQGGARRGEPKFEDKLVALKAEVIAELLFPPCRIRFFRAAKCVDDISKDEFIETAVAGGSLQGHEKFVWNRFNRAPEDVPAPRKSLVQGAEQGEAEDDFLRNRSKSFMAAARGFPSLALADCPNLVTDWPVGERTGPCPDCNHPRNQHPRGAVPGVPVETSD